MRVWDAIVVGAGVVGLLTAIELASRGVEVLVVEAERPGGGASSRNAGVLHVVQPPPGRLRRRLAYEGLKLYPRLLEDLGVEHVETELIIPAFTRVQEALTPILAASIKALAAHSKPKIERGRDVLRREPALRPGVRRAVVVGGYITLDPEELVSRLADKAVEMGVGIARGRVETIACRDGQVEVIADRLGTLEARVLVNTAGAGAAELARQMGLGVEVKLAAGAMTLHRRLGVSSIVSWFPSRGVRETKGGAVIPWPGGRVILGPTFSKPGQPPHSPEEVVSRYSGLLNVEPPSPERYIVGYRTMASKRDFILARDERCGLTIHALGIESPGLTAAPALARRLASMALSVLKDL